MDPFYITLPMPVEKETEDGIRIEYVNIVSAYPIPNTRGTILPETGGTGTKLFLLGGSIAAIGAVVLLVTRQRMQNYE